MTRTSIKTLDSLVASINAKARVTETGWRTIKDGTSTRNIAPVGAYMLDHSFGGYELHRIVNEAGAVDVILPRSTAGEMEELLRAFFKGLCAQIA